jgi:hypothetical protein
VAQFRAEIEGTKGARSVFSALALANNPVAWGAPVVSLIITLGFFGILTLLIARRTPATEVAQIVNITVGALAAAFATVVSFWLGSSQGSRQKDDAAIQLQAKQVQSQAKQAEVLTTTMQATPIPGRQPIREQIIVRPRGLGALRRGRRGIGPGYLPGFRPQPWLWPTSSWLRLWSRLWATTRLWPARSVLSQLGQ